MDIRLISLRFYLIYNTISFLEIVTTFYKFKINLDLLCKTILGKLQEKYNKTFILLLVFTIENSSKQLNIVVTFSCQQFCGLSPYHL